MSHLSNEEKLRLISALMKTPEGRQRIAAPIIEAAKKRPEMLEGFQGALGKSMDLTLGVPEGTHNAARREVTTHLLSNGHLRCGAYPGHISTGQVGSWPRDLRVTASTKNTTCPTCRQKTDLPPIEVSDMLANMVEDIKTAIQTMSAMDAVAFALDQGVTIADLVPLTRRVALEMS